MTSGTTERIDALLREHGVIDGHNDLLWVAREKVGYDFDRLELTDTDMCRAVGAAHRPAAAARRGSRRPVLVGVRARRRWPVTRRSPRRWSRSTVPTP